jgi:hypothetical protein
MALVNWQVEIRTDFNDKKLDKLFEKALRQMAHEAIATASLLADGRPPDIAIHTSDMFVGREKLMLFDEETTDHE